jgi:hypothetical protein
VSNIFDLDITAEDAEAATKAYRPSVQEGVDETPEQVDNSPISDSERKALDEADRSSFEGLPHQQPESRDHHIHVAPGDTYVHPKIRHRQQQALMLQSPKVLDDLDARISTVTKHGGLPKDVSDLATKARLAVGSAREAYLSAQNPDKPRFAVSIAAKDTVQIEIGKAVTAVGALEGLFDEGSVQGAQFETLVANLEKDREATIKALRAALTRYGNFRGTVERANAVALEGGRWDKEFHRGVVSNMELDAPLKAMQAALDFLEGEDDAASGRFLTVEYEGLPPHTLARLKRSAEVAGGASFAAQVYHRARNLARDDVEAQIAVDTKRLLPLLNSNPFESQADDTGNFW